MYFTANKIHGVKWAAAGSVAAGILLAAGSALAADDGAAGWSDTAEFGYVLTDGNAESSTLGFKNTLTRAWERTSMTFKVGGVRAESTNTVSRFAVGTPDDFTETRITQDETTAESYYLNGRYDHKITDSFFWYAGAGWDRNRPAGVENRYTGVGGVGNIWYDTDTIKFKTDYALTYTDQEDVITNPAVDDTFAGFRFSWAYLHKFGENTTYTNDLVFDENVDETDDWRADMTNSLAVAMSKRLALKVSLQWLYDNQPAFDEVALFDTVGGTQIGTVFIAKDELDTIFTASLVVNF